MPQVPLVYILLSSEGLHGITETLSDAVALWREIAGAVTANPRRSYRLEIYEKAPNGRLTFQEEAELPVLFLFEEIAQRSAC